VGRPDVFSVEAIAELAEAVGLQSE
jgi:hypothetical protein